MVPRTVPGNNSIAPALGPTLATFEWVWQQVLCLDPQNLQERPEAWWVLLTLHAYSGLLFSLFLASVLPLDPGQGPKPLPLGPAGCQANSPRLLLVFRSVVSTEVPLLAILIPVGLSASLQFGTVLVTIR